MEHTCTCRDDSICLCPLSAEDSERYRLLRNREENRRCFFFSGIITREAQQKWYAQYLKRENDYMFSVYTLSGIFLGGAALYDIKEDTAEFGRLLIDREAAGRGGVGAQTLSLLCTLARDELKLTSLHLELYADNLSALKTYEKLGFLFRKQYPAPDGVRYMNYMEKFL